MEKGKKKERKKERKGQLELKISICKDGYMYVCTKYVLLNGGVLIFGSIQAEVQIQFAS